MLAFCYNTLNEIFNLGVDVSVKPVGIPEYTETYTDGALVNAGQAEPEVEGLLSGRSFEWIKDHKSVAALVVVLLAAAVVKCLYDHHKNAQPAPGQRPSQDVTTQDSSHQLGEGTQGVRVHASATHLAPNENEQSVGGPSVQAPIEVSEGDEWDISKFDGSDHAQYDLVSTYSNENSYSPSSNIRLIEDALSYFREVIREKKTELVDLTSFEMKKAIELSENLGKLSDILHNHVLNRDYSDAKKLAAIRAFTALCSNEVDPIFKDFKQCGIISHVVDFKIIVRDGN